MRLHDFSSSLLISRLADELQSLFLGRFRHPRSLPSQTKKILSTSHSSGPENDDNWQNKFELTRPGWTMKCLLPTSTNSRLNVVAMNCSFGTVSMTLANAFRWTSSRDYGTNQKHSWSFTESSQKPQSTKKWNWPINLGGWKVMSVSNNKLNCWEYYCYG